MRPTRLSDIGRRVPIYLARAGWVKATRGRNGGLRLAADPAVLTVGAVLREREGDTELVDCEGSGCRLRPRRTNAPAARFFITLNMHIACSK